MENKFVSPVICALVLWRTSLCHLYFSLRIDGEPVCVTFVKRSRLMENQFDVGFRLMQNQFDVRSRLMENQFDMRSGLMENHFDSPLMCAPD
ncbi:hypothetical protein RRG08_049784 [Elysia crispata]|uniref:Secreted protein n=1 Tax=Elysia crispata TaxID=231223 RepID=A0AAE0YU81_9GAST|nr:hypothetical protein RRG08_049784 [Elysia crispata]